MNRVLGTISVVFTLILAQLPPLTVKAANEDIWQGSVTITSGEPLTLQQITNKPYCAFKDVYVKVFGQPLDDIVSVLGSGNYVKDNLGTKCVVGNNQGYFSNVSYSNNSLGAGYELEQPATSTFWYDPAPAGDAVLLINKPALSTVYTVGVEYDFASNGQPNLSLTNVKWHYNGGALQLIDSSGNAVRLSNHAFSNNGRYMAIRYNGEVALVDLENLSMTPVGYFSSWSNSSELAVSSNGKYVAVENNGLYIFGTSGCQTTYLYGHWDLTQTASPTGCTKSINLRSQLLAAMGQSQLVSDFQNMWYSPDSSTLHIGTGVRRPDAPPNLSGPTAYNWTDYSLRPDGFQNTANGYLAMGDSFSSGEGDTEGNTWYEPGTDEHGDTSTFAGRNLCHLSRRSYPYLLAMSLGYMSNNSSSPPSDGLFHSVACSGAKMHNISGVVGEKQDDGSAVDFAVTDNQYRYIDIEGLNEWQPGFEKQLGYIVGRLDNVAIRGRYNPDVITISIGGNDVGFGQVITACVNFGTCPYADDQTYRERLVEEMASEVDNLTSTYTNIKLSAPESKVYVVGYPQFVQAEGGTCGNNVHFNDQERIFVSKSTEYFNQIIETATKRAGVVYVDVSDILNGTNLCSGVSDSQITVNGATAGNDTILPFPGNPEGGVYSHGFCIVRECIGSESYHPNPRGHELYADRILQATSNFSTVNPSAVQTILPLPDLAYFGYEAQAYVNYINGVTLDEVDLAKIADFVSGVLDYREPTISLEDLLPNSEVSVEIHSDPVELGSFIVGTDGSVNGGVTIPDTIQPGYHELHIHGIDKFGNKVHLYQPIMLGATADDFDGDRVLNDVDSCPTITNSLVDVDQDGIDDACDPEAIPVVTPPPTDDGHEHHEHDEDHNHSKNNEHNHNCKTKHSIICRFLDWKRTLDAYRKSGMKFWNLIVERDYKSKKH